MPDWRTVPPDWSIVKEFRDLDVLVTVSATNSHRPMYSISVSKMHKDKVYKFFPVRFRGKGKLEPAEDSIAPIIARLYKQAEEWCLEKAQERENEIIDEMAKKEQAEIDRQKPRPPRGTHS